MGRFCFNLRYKHKFAVQLEVHKGEENTCFLSKQKFRGTCKIQSCHANLAVNKSRCLYLFYPDKTEFDRFDVMFALNLKEKHFRDKYLLGKKRVKAAIILNNILTRLRNNDKHNHCERCGVLRSTKGPCLNIIECNKRVDLGLRFLKDSSLRFYEIKASRNDVWLLLYNMQGIEQFVSTESGYELSVNDILGVDDDLLDKSNLLRNFV